MARGRMSHVPCSGHTDRAPLVERQHPPHPGIVVELGKPVVFPSGWADRVSTPQGVERSNIVTVVFVYKRYENRVLGSLRRSGVSLSLSFGETIILPLAAKEQEMCHLLRTGIKSAIYRKTQHCSRIRAVSHAYGLRLGSIAFS